jgi:hypothetical protein
MSDIKKRVSNAVPVPDETNIAMAHKKLKDFQDSS